MLSILESDHGAALAAKVARELVVFARRNGDSAPLSPFLSRRDHLNPTVHRAQDLIMQDLRETHSLQDLARAVRLSPRGLSSAFVAATGTTPARYLRELRLAENLLRQTNQPIENIAAECGFHDDRNFRRVFTSQHGISPSAFRLSTAA
ncbi:GlxA family transcriptional regulator [Arthrobacter bambusae]|uniref:Transcriptional regulator GlxA family with amidase domain n=1 Tax=Arthrobacter bambusae TaxID=1338426 RepID=A0AAW8DLL4_9MICC|nr:helix-turn-helix domain-containing protein [Arthrobacter bambusae]MDP9906213.1 transcriptional regulator GlxA family with amidase domain [Arthrobacter bambusae]MDQ0130554.1 transcriptional regulator GlxA family with amidase domain [Arthrobacter bambusae]